VNREWPFGFDTGVIAVLKKYRSISITEVRSPGAG